jgi:hypothetical protein
VLFVDLSASTFSSITTMLVSQTSSILWRTALHSSHARTLSNYMDFSTTSTHTKDIIFKRNIVGEIAETHELSISKSGGILNTILNAIVEVSRYIEDE